MIFCEFSLNFIQKESPTLVFSCEFCKNFKNNFLTEQIRVIASMYYDVTTLILSSLK